jgi:hypothetical protein
MPACRGPPLVSRRLSFPPRTTGSRPDDVAAREVEAEAKRVTATVGCCWRCRLPPSRLDRCGVWLGEDPRPRRSGSPRPAEPATGLCARPSPSRALPCFRGGDASPPSCLPRDLPAIASPDSADYPVESTRAKRACRGRVKQRSFLHIREGGHARARTRCAGSPPVPARDSTSTRLACAFVSPSCRTGWGARAALDERVDNGTSPAVDPVCLKGALPRRAKRVLA